MRHARSGSESDVGDCIAVGSLALLGYASLLKTRSLAGGTAPPDSDHDGMPDAWETANGLNPNDASDRNRTWGPGYTMLEKYLNSIDSF
jgi:hypothetical protein